MINVYTSIADENPVATYTHDRQTLLSWLESNVKNYVVDDRLIITINDNPIPPKCYNLIINSDDTVRIYPVPKGVETSAIVIGVVSAVLSVAAVIYGRRLAKKRPGERADGSKLKNTGVDANMPRLRDVVPDIAGSYKVYPDLLMPPRVYFEDPRTRVKNLMLCIGVGEYQIDNDDVLIGESKVSSLNAGSIEFNIYNPDADLTGVEQNEWWQPSEEVGENMDGGSGIELQVGHVGVNNMYQVDFISIGWGGVMTDIALGKLIPDWDPDSVIKLEIFEEFNRNGNAIEGDFKYGRPIKSGDIIHVSGEEFDEVLEVDDFVLGAVGQLCTWTGQSAPELDYSSNPKSLSVFWRGIFSRIELDSTFANINQLVNHLNANSTSGGPTFSNFSGVIRVSEPFESGENIVVSGDLDEIFGSGYDIVDSKAESDKYQLTLKYIDSGDSFIPDGVWPKTLSIGKPYYKMYHLGFLIIYRFTRLNEDLTIDEDWSGFSDGGLIQTPRFYLSPYMTNKTDTWAGWYRATPVGQVTDKVEFSVMFPRGLIRFKSNGHARLAIQSLYVEYRKVGSNVPLSATFTYADTTEDQIGFTEVMDLPESGDWEFRFRVSGSDSTNRLICDVSLMSFNARIYGEPSSYPWTTMSMKIRDISKISINAQQRVNLIANRKLNVVTDEGLGSLAKTRNPADFLAYIALDSGYPSSMIDWVSLDSLRQLWNSRGDAFDHVFDETTVSEALHLVMKSGMGDLTLRHGVITPLREGERSSFDQAQSFSLQNTTDGIKRFVQLPNTKDHDGVDIEFVDRDQSWTKQTIKIRLPEDTGAKSLKINLDGVTDYTQAWRIGWRERLAQKYQRWTYEFTTELEGQNLTYLDYIPLIIDQSGFARSALLNHSWIDGIETFFEISEPIEFEDPLIFAWRNIDGTFSGIYNAEKVDDNTIKINGSFDVSTSVQLEPIHVYYGTNNELIVGAIVTDVSSKDDGYNISVKAVNYDSRIYQNDDAQPQ